MGADATPSIGRSNAPKRAILHLGAALVGWSGPMGVKWTARLKVDFEMDEGISANLAEARLKVSAVELQRFIEMGHGNGRTRDKPGSAKVDIVAQGQTAW
jgi:hypothetical protein